MGPDGIHPRGLKELADIIAGPLSIIFQLSWESGEVPVDCKMANVVPIFKKCQKEDPSNYRPVGLMPVPGKMMEKRILEVIEAHLGDNAVIGPSQHGFTRGRSCLRNLMKAADVIILDFSNAFDTRGGAEVTGPVQPGKEEAQGRPHRGLQLPHLGERRGRRRPVLFSDQ